MNPPDETLEDLELDDFAIGEAEFEIRPVERRFRQLVRHVAALVEENRELRRRVDHLDERLDLAESHARDQDAERRREVDALGETLQALIREADSVAARTR